MAKNRYLNLNMGLVKENFKHKIYTSQFCDKFPEQAETGKKKKSFKDGTMQDYWLVVYDSTYLSV